MESENVGVLLHKLTKYQTLLANSNENSKMSTYKQKINQYTSKLENLGIERSTLNQMGGLNDENYNKVLTGLIEQQSNKIREKIDLVNKGVPANSEKEKEIVDSASNLVEMINQKKVELTNNNTNYNDKVKVVQDTVNRGVESYNLTVSNLVKLIRKLLNELIELEKLLGTMGVPKSVDLSSITNSIDTINKALIEFTINDPKDLNVDFNTDSVVVNKYIELLIADINNNENNKFVDKDGKHTDLLSVELRQLVSLMELEKNDLDFETKIKQQFYDGTTDLGKLTDEKYRTALKNLIDGNGTTIKPFKEKL